MRALFTKIFSIKNDTSAEMYHHIGFFSSQYILWNELKMFCKENLLISNHNLSYVGYSYENCHKSNYQGKLTLV